MRRAAREIGSAVDRIDDPDRRLRRAGKTVAFLADETVFGKYPGHARLNQPFNFAIDLGDEILRPLEADREGASVEEAAPRQRARFARDRAGGEETVLQRGRVDGQIVLLGRQSGYFRNG